VEQVMADYIFPLPGISSSSKGNDLDDTAWTDRLLSTVGFLDEKALNSLLSFSGLKAKYVTVYLKILNPLDSGQSTNHLRDFHRELH
jgi:sister-chromatid-cohesion protein PDS5